jgi:hypothetical protein
MNYFCKDGNISDKNPLFCKINHIKMKKIVLILLAFLFAGFLMSSCRSSSCAAYGETNQYQIETRY